MPLLALLVLLLLVAAGVGYVMVRPSGDATTADRPALRHQLVRVAEPVRLARPRHPRPRRRPRRRLRRAAPAAPAAPAAGTRDPGVPASTTTRPRPDDHDAGWALLGPHEQSVGRSSYDDFWDGIDRVDVSGVQAHPARSTSEVTLTYHYEDGRVVQERQRLELLRSSGSWLIDGDDVLSSRTVSG